MAAVARWASWSDHALVDLVIRERVAVRPLPEEALLRRLHGRRPGGGRLLDLSLTERRRLRGCRLGLRRIHGHQTLSRCSKAPPNPVQLGWLQASHVVGPRPRSTSYTGCSSSCQAATSTQANVVLTSLAALIQPQLVLAFELVLCVVLFAVLIAVLVVVVVVLFGVVVLFVLSGLCVVLDRLCPRFTWTRPLRRCGAAAVERPHYC